MFKKTSFSRREKWYGYGFILPFFILFILSFLIPLLASLWNSLFKEQLSLGGLGPLQNTFVGFENYLEVLTSKDFWVGMGNVAGYGIIKIPLVQGLALILALVLDSLAARGVRFFRLIYFFPYAIPGVVGAILWAYLYSPNLSPFTQVLNWLGLPEDFFLLNGHLNLSMANMTAWTFVGYNMIIFMATLKSVPSELYEAARIDGAGEWRIVWKIKIPLLRGALLMTVLMSIIGTVQWFNEPTVLRTMVGTINSNYTPMMMAYSQAFGAQNMGGASAVSVCMAVVAGLLAAGYAWVQSKIGRRNYAN